MASSCFRRSSNIWTCLPLLALLQVVPLRAGPTETTAPLEVAETRVVHVTGDSATVARIAPLMARLGTVIHVADQGKAYSLALVEPQSRLVFTVSVRDAAGQVLVRETVKAFSDVADSLLPPRIRGRHRAAMVFEDMPQSFGGGC